MLDDVEHEDAVESRVDERELLGIGLRDAGPAGQNAVRRPHQRKLHAHERDALDDKLSFQERFGRKIDVGFRRLRDDATACTAEPTSLAPPNQRDAAESSEPLRRAPLRTGEPALVGVS